MAAMGIRGGEMLSVLLFLLVVCFPSMGQAQPQPPFRVYLSGNGSNGNDCSVNMPCRTLGHAIQVVRDGGEVWMLDSANFGAEQVTIDRAVKILAIPGAQGSIAANAAVNGPDALVINAPGKDVTLRNLVILNISNGINGVRVVDAGAVHIEKTTITDFSDPAGNCVLMSTSNAVRLYIDDTTLRHCHVAVHGVVNVNPADEPLIILDGVRIERGFVVGGAVPTIGVWQQGCVGVTLRNSTVSNQENAILADGLVPGCLAAAIIVHSELFANTTSFRLNGTATGVNYAMTLHQSQIIGSSEGIVVSNTGNVQASLDILQSQILYPDTTGIRISHTASSQAQVFLNIAESQIGDTSGNAIDVSANTNAAVRVSVKDSTLSVASGRLFRTAGSGTSSIEASMIRTTFSNANYGIEHGFGTIHLDGCQFKVLANSIVNNGSGSVFSMGNNMRHFNIDSTGGLTYITPTVCTAGAALPACGII